MSSGAVDALMDPEKAFISSLGLIDQRIEVICRRNGMRPADAEDFSAWAKARLIDHDYAVFRKFGGRSSLATYLSVVLANLLRDYCNERWGRWRPSAEAKRRGPVAVQLEQMIYRDGHSIREAVQVIRTAGTELTEAELIRLAHFLPHQVRGTQLQWVELTPDTPLAESSTVSSIDTGVDDVHGALQGAIAELAPDDALVVRLRFWSEMAVADIARTLGLDQKKLYRRIDRIQRALRESLQRRGLNGEDVRELMGNL